MSVFIQPTVPHLGEPELPFDDTELVFHLCPDPGLVPVPAALVVGQCSVPATLRLGKVLGAWRTIGNGFLLASICGIAPPGFPHHEAGRAAPWNRAHWPG